MAENMFCQTEKNPKNITLIAISRVWLWAARHEIYGVDRCFSRVTLELLTKEALRVTVIDCAVNLCGLVGVACPAACHVWGDCFCFLLLQKFCRPCRPQDTPGTPRQPHPAGETCIGDYSDTTAVSFVKGLLVLTVSFLTDEALQWVAQCDAC